MKRRVASSNTFVLALSIAFLASTAYGQRLRSDDIRESNDPARAAEVERKAEAISGRSLSGSGESGEEASEKSGPGSVPAESRMLNQERGEGESGGKQESSEPPYEAQSLPENSGGSSGEAPLGGGDKERKTNRRGPAGSEDIYH